MKNYTIELKEVIQPKKDGPLLPVELSDETINLRHQKILAEMKKRELDLLIIYGDVEHGSNFEYCTGFFTRFEESLLLIHRNKEATLMLGNENLNKAAKARIQARAVHVCLFSLPNQPSVGDKTLIQQFMEEGISQHSRIGIVGWKMFTSPLENNKTLFDVPYYIIDAIKHIVKNDSLISNETDLFIGENGVRTTNNANEIAHYEFGASLASDCVLDAMNELELGVSEMQLADKLVRNGQHTSIVTIAASGERFIKANMFPSNKQVRIKDPISLTVGYRGGSTSRAGVAVHERLELPKNQQDYLERVARPYFAAMVCWLEEIKIGMTGSTLFEKIEKILPRSRYGWSLCPGHLTAEEEWMSSPVYENSPIKLESGMIFQLDIIPSVAGYPGICAESTVVLANDMLKSQIQKENSKMWIRMQQRRNYVQEVLGLELSEDILLMGSLVGYLRPYMLDKKRALVKVNN